MAVSREPRKCSGHLAYRSKAEAHARISWHLTCFKCRAGLVMNAFRCNRGWEHWHIGHHAPTEIERRMLSR